MTPFGLHASSRPMLIRGDSGEELSFREGIEAGREIVAPLGDTKQLLFLLSLNDVFSATTYAGALLAGHAVAFLDAQGPRELSASVISAYRPTWLAGPLGTGEAVAGSGIPVEMIAARGGGEVIRTAFREDGQAISRPKIHPDLTVMLGTSGTTGSRKFVRLSRRNIESNAASIAEYLSLTPDERPVTSMPFHYSMGLSVVNSHWAAGAPVVLTSQSVIQQSFWAIVRARECTSLAGVPFTFQMLERAGFRSMDLPSLRTLLQAGGALDVRLARTYAEHMAARGGRFFVMYGQTEATARISYVPPARLLDKLGSAGIPIPGGRLSVFDAGAPNEDGGRRPGEIVYEGPNVMMGYAAGPEDLRLGDDLRGVLRTGDIGYLDDEGYLFLVGRSKRITKVHGLRINLDEFESVLRVEGPAAVVGGEDAIWGFCAFGTDESIAELARSLARRFRLHHSTVRLRRVEAIPTSGFGKTDYRQVQQWIAA